MSHSPPSADFLSKAAVEDGTSSLFLAGSQSVFLRRNRRKISAHLSSGSLSVALLADALVERMVMCCFVGFETMLMDLLSLCELSVRSSGKFGIE